MKESSSFCFATVHSIGEKKSVISLSISLANGSLLLLVLLVLSSGCRSTVSIPQNDPTPPTAGLDLNTPRGLVSAAAPGGDHAAIVFVTDSIDLMGLGKDEDGGVKRASVTISTALSCGNLHTGLGTSRNSSRTVEAADPSPGFSGPTFRYVGDSIKVADLLTPCGAETTFRELTLSAFSMAENYQGSTATTGNVSFRIAPFLRVATFNLHKSQDGPLSRAVLLTDEADIVFLQEIDGSAQATALAAGSALSNMRYFENLAIISRCPLSNVVEHRIPNIADTRFVLEATITVDAMTIRLLNSHFSHSSPAVGDREALRIASAHFIISLINQTPSTHIIFGGDVNGLRGSPEYSVLAATLSDASAGVPIPASVQCSFPGIDFVFFRGPFHTLAFESVCPPPHPSDHPFVWSALARTR